MKLNDTRPTIETSGNMEEQLFSIQDTGMIFDILRNKMYSDPIRAICREISSNARDAHREVGKEDVPCEITLPSRLNQFYKIKDFGPGISPERIANVFIKYTGSTKRNDNTQTGGFGLGAKTPFSYNDEFAINTVVDGKKYSYSCFIDETKVGKIVCMDIQPSTEPNSTEISIPVKLQDFRKFIEDTEYVTRHWTVRPTIKGVDIVYKDIKPSLKGKSYSIVRSNGYYDDKVVKLIIDGIEYPLDTAQLKTFASTQLLDAMQGTIYLYFGVGELSLSATREAVHLDKPTQAKIAAVMNDIVSDIKKDVQKQIDSQTSLWNAAVWVTNDLRKTFSRPEFLGNLAWNGNVIKYNSISCGYAPVYLFERGKTVKHKFDESKIHRRYQGSISFLENTEIYLCDLALKEPHIKNVSKAFNDNPKLKYVYVVMPSKESDIEEIDKKYDLTAYGAKKLSTITKVGKNYNTSGIRMLVFKFSSSGFRQISYADMEVDTNKKIICSLAKDTYTGNRDVVLKDNKKLDKELIKAINSLDTSYSIYGVDSNIPITKVEENFSDFKPIDDFISENLSVSKKNDFLEMKYYFSQRYNIDRESVNSLFKIKDKIVDKKSYFLNYIEFSNIIKDKIQDNFALLRTYEDIYGILAEADVATWLKDNPDKNLSLVKAKFNKKYGLLQHVNYYEADTLLEPLTHYVNMIDKG